MKESEAIKICNTIGFAIFFSNPKGVPLNTTKEELTEAMRMSIQALEKQIPKKPPVVNRPSIFIKVPVCPNCSTSEHYQPLYGKTKYCSNCGQKLDWSDEE